MKATIAYWVPLVTGAGEANSTSTQPPAVETLDAGKCCLSAASCEVCLAGSARHGSVCPSVTTPTRPVYASMPREEHRYLVFTRMSVIYGKAAAAGPDRQRTFDVLWITGAFNWGVTFWRWNRIA